MASSFDSLRDQSIIMKQQAPVRRLQRRYFIHRLSCALLIFAAIFYCVGTWTFSSIVHAKSDVLSCDMHSSKNELTSSDFSYLCDDPAISYLKISHPPPPSNRPKVLCVVLTHSKSHNLRMKSVVDTWGKKCDGLIGASDVKDLSLHTYQIDSQQGYLYIFDKLVHTLRRILEKDPMFTQNDSIGNILTDYDWILKADDDTYMIMENLQSFLANITLPIEEPQVYGRVMAWPRFKRFKSSWFSSNFPNQDFGRRFYDRFDEMETLRFSHGGPGYVFNRRYAEILVDAYFNASGNAVKGAVAEDMGGALTMLFHGVRPRSTYDFDTERERMHPESPQTMFENPPWLEKTHHGIKSQLKGKGEVCCSPSSLSFHYVADFQMRLLDYQLYNCPQNRPLTN